MQLEPLDRLRGLLRELFQLDLSDLDFGLYRLLRIKRDEVEAFLDEQLPRRVREAFEDVAAEDRAAAERETAELADRIRREVADDAILPNGDVDPRHRENPARAIRELIEAYDAARARVAAARSHEALQGEVFNHLYNFFSRYYEDGDFIPRRWYGAARERFAVPYNGEETFFHWANRGQHYVKTGEVFRDYAFTVDAGFDGTFRVRFVLTDAKLPTGNNKGDTRFFVPLPEDVAEDADARTLTVPFHYRPLTDEERARYGDNGRVQDAILVDAAPAILDAIRSEALAAALAAPSGEPAGDEAPPSLLLRRLRHFARRNTSDFFVHRDLRGFLQRELEFYLKDQVLHIGDLDADLPAKLRTLRAVRRVAGEIIEFLAQLEEVQRRLFEKRKFVLRTDWLVLIKDVPRALWPEVLANEAQLEAWRTLFHIDPAKDLFNPNGEVNEAFLEAHPTLVVDTRHFDQDFVDRLLEGFDGDLDDAVGGILIHGENYQALRLLERKYAGAVKCIYIDPPYNTGSDDFIYKDRYRHSSWLAMMEERLRVARGLLAEDGAIFVSIDDNEQASLKRLLDEVFGSENFIDTIVWQKVYAPKSSARHFSASHDFLIVYGRNAESWTPGLLPRTAKADAQYSNPDNDPRGPWMSDNLTARNYYSKGSYEVVSPSGKTFKNPPGTYWRISKERFEELDKDGRIWWGPDGNNVPRLKRFLSEVKQGLVPQTLWLYKDVGHTQEAKKELLAIVDFERNEDVLNTVKPTRLIRRILQVNTGADAGHVVVDFFAGSGSTGDAVIQQNREDGGNRRFVLAETGGHFDTITLQRVARALYAAEWKSGRPSRLPTPEEVERTPRVVKVLRIESYEDALHNLATEETLAREAPRADAHQKTVGEDAYRLRYLARLPLEASASLLHLDRLEHPFRYTIEVLTDQGPRERTVDLIETFNLVYGLHVERRERWTNPEDPERLYRVVRARDRDGKRILVLWRDVEGLDPVLERRWLEPRLAETGPWDEVLCNADCATPGVRSLDPDFKRLIGEEER